MQELHSETPLKRENPPQKNEKERKSHELEANCMGIATDDVALEKHEEKKRRKMKEIKVSEVVGLDSSGEPESKEEKKKRKREKSHKHENKERKSQEVEVISMEIGSGVTLQEAEASSEKYDKKKREIEADKDSVVVSREASDKPESKTEKKKKRKREKSHKHDKPEYSGVLSHEGFVEPESKAGKKKKKRNREKTGKHDKSGKKSQDIEDNSTQEAEAASEKHDKKKRKKNKEIYVDKDIEVVSQEGFAEGSTKDKKRKKKSRKEKNEEEIDISSKEQQLSAEDKVQNKKQKKGKEVVVGGLESSRENVSGKERTFDDAETSKEKKPTQKKPRKSVSFSGDVEVFPLGNDADAEADDNTEKPLVQGKRFTKEEDELLKNAVQKYIEGNQLGNEGLHMVLNCMKYPQARNCWRDIGLSIPWRPLEAVYYRAHVLFERSEARKWEPHEYDTLLRLHKLHGKNWKLIGEELGKHRFQVKDTWRRIENQNRRYGRWSQEEYQALFDLVNLDLTMKAYDEKKTKHGMLKDNISWKAIGKKLSTRNFQSCCTKWYYQLASPLVKEGHWYNSDDYRLLDALEKQDACCVEDVDWDNLLGHRSGEYCQRRWSQMVRYIGGYREKPFIEQVEVLCNRYCPEMLKYKNDEEALASGSSLHKETENGEHVNAP